MLFDILTLFPDVLDKFLTTSIIGKAQQKGIFNVNTINIRDFSTNKHKKVDDYPYGGGSGMIMTSQPIYDAYCNVLARSPSKPHCIYVSPQGRLLNQDVAKELKEKHSHILILCGHYEGIDERIIEEIVDEEISIGDFVLTGGELPALILVDCIARMIPGVLGAEDGYLEDSIYAGVLEYPQYTRPAEFLGRKVPEILLEGHHEKIRKWRKKQSLIRTYQKRKDLFDRIQLTKEDLMLIQDTLE